MITMTRRVAFSAGKVDWPAGDAPSESADIFSGADALEPYGHNYNLDVSVTGSINARTGIIVNIKEIDRIVQEHVIDRFDRKLINRQAREFCRKPVTCESLALWIADSLRSALPQETELTAVRVEETPLVAAEWRATETMEPIQSLRAEHLEMRTTRVYEFAASHRLHSPHLSDEENRELFGKCNYPNGHGHNYILEVTVAGPLDDRTGRVIDPALLDEIVNRVVVDRYDHRHLNYDIPEFAEIVPSTEAVTKIIWERLEGEIPNPVRLYSVLIRETARNIFEYRREA